MRRFWKILFCLALLVFSARAALATTITRIGAANFFVDSNKPADYQDNYVGYAILNNDGVNYDSVWVTIDTFTGVMSLGNNEDGKVNLGPLASGATKYAYFFCHSSANTGACGHTVHVYNGLPTLGAQITSQIFAYTAAKSISALANKVTSVVSGPTPPTLGGIVTITEYGDSGTVGAGDSVAITPASLPSWDSGAYELYSVSMTITNGGGPLTFNDSLNCGPLPGSGGGYSATYLFRAVNTTVTPTAVSPIANVASGTQFKYTANPGAGLAPIAQVTNGLTLVNESVSCGGVSATGTNITYTLTLSNSSPNDAFLDAFVVTLSGSPTNATYVNNTTKTNNVSYSNPAISSTSSNQTLTWSGYFLVPANGTRNLSFQAGIPAVFGGYTNTAYAMIGTNKIDTTLALGDSAPAVCSYTISPLADVQVTKSGLTNVFAGTNLVYTLSVTNLGPSASSNLIVIDQLPTNVTFVSASSAGFLTNGQVQWTNLTVFTNGQSTNFTVTVTIPSSSGTITNVVSSSAATADPVPGNNNGTATNAIVTTTILAQADVRTTKTGPTNVFASTNFSYAISLTNVGPSTATSITLTDSIPSGVTFVSATGNGLLTNGVVKWSIASLTNGASTNFTLTVTAPPNTATLTNRISSGSIDYDPVPANNDGTGTNAVVITTVQPQADLLATKSGSTNVFAATNLTYTIALTNMGPSTATSVVLTDALPASVTFVTASTGFTFTNGLVTWPIASFTNGASTNFTVTVTVPASGLLTNRVSAGGAEFDPASGNNDGTATNAIVITSITPQADLFATKTGPTNVFAGTNFSYTITLTNLGPSTATSIVVTDALPSGVSFVSASTGFTFTNGLVTWPIASFTNGATTNLNVMVSAPANGTLTNRVSAGGAIFDPVLNNNDGTATNAIVVTTITPLADLQTTKTGPTNVFAGTNFSYSISLTNIGPSTATSLVVTDTLPTGVTFVTASAGFTLTNGFVTWPIVAFTNGAATNFSVTVTAPASGTLTNRVSSGSLILDPVPANNDGTALSAMVVTTVTPQADLQVTKTGPTNVFASTNFSYTVTLTNSGPSTATSVIVTDALPVGVTFVTATPGFTFTNGLITWPLVSFTNGASTNFNVTVTAPANATSLTNVVSGGSATFDPVFINNDGSAAGAKVITTVTAVSDLQATKTGPTNVFAATNFSYTVTLTNSGPSTASNIAITDALPAGVTFVSASGNPTVSSSNVVWQVASFTNAAFTNFTLTITAPANSAILTNVVSSGSETIDPIPGNNNGSAAAAVVTTTVTPRADIVAAKTGPANVLANTNFNYTITLTNFGPSLATSIVVTDALPPEVTFFSASGGGVFTNGIVTWPIASLTNGAVTNLTLTVTSPSEGTVTNRVSSGSSIFDPVPANNDGSAVNATVLTAVTPVADLQVTKSGPATVFAATNFSYTINLTNLGPSTAAGVVVTDALPIGVTFVTASSGYTLTTNGLVTWALASFTNGANTNLTVTVTAPVSGTITNRVSAGGTTIDLTPANNNGTATNAIVTTTIIPVADLQATKTGPASVFAATNFSYTITLTNIGPSTATSVVLTDALPAGVTFVTATPGFAVSNGIVTWPLATLASGVATNFNITVTAPTSGTLTNRALVGSATIDPVLNNNDGTATNAIAITAVTPVADVQTTKTGPAAMGAGTNILYTISVTNSGPSTATNIVVLDTLPTGVTVVGVSSGGVANTNSVTWSGLSLTNGASTNFTVTIKAVSGPITNFVSSTSGVIDPVPANNDGSSPAARVITTIAVGVPVSGFVYNDANQNGFKDGSEAGTGLALYAKIFPVSNPAGPAIQAVVVNPATGGYSFSNISTGTYTILVDDNNTLSDIAPALPSGWTGLESPAQIRNNISVLNAPVGNQNFGLIQALTLKGTVFKDTGSSGGIANDGIKNGAEVGLGNVVMKLTDASGGTIYSTVTTAGDGGYTLTIPGSVTNGVQLRVVEINLTAYRSTGASVGNTAGTYVRTNDVITFTYAAGTLYTGVDFGDVPENEFTTDGRQSGLPGSIVVYSHTFTAGSVGAVTFATTKISTPNLSGWNSVVYKDNNCNAQIDAGDTVISGPVSVQADEKICLLVKEFIPAGTPNDAQDQVTISASFSYTGATPALSTLSSRVDLTTVGTSTLAGLSLLKEVDKATALPGEIITYTITYKNASSTSLSNIVIFDATPSFTKFYSATNSLLGPGLNSVDLTAPVQGEAGAIRWSFSGALTPEGSGNVIYKVTIE